MLVIFDSCLLCNRFLAETSSSEDCAYDIGLTSICKIFQVNADEYHLKAFPTCRLCQSCGSLAVRSSEVLKQIELLQIELEELSKQLKDVFRESIEEGKGSVWKSEANTLESLRLCLSKGLNRQVEAGGVIQIIPISKEEFNHGDGFQSDVEDNKSHDCHGNANTDLNYSEGINCSSSTTVEFTSGLADSASRTSSKNFRTFTVQGHVLKDLEIKLERLPRNYILNALGRQSAPAESAICGGIDDVDVSAYEEIEDEDDWYLNENYSEASSDDDYLPRKSQNRQKLRKQKDASDCNKEFETLDDDRNSNSAFSSKLRKHERVYSEEDQTRKFTCKTCHLSFDSWSERTQHRKQEHPDEAKLEEEALHCQICDKFLRSRNTFRSHMKLHQEAKRVCETCGKSCDGAAALKRHMKRHKKDKICELCGKGFAFDYELNDHHLKNHEGKGDQRMIPCCKACDRTFDSWQLMLQHRDQEHATRNEQHQCEVCGKILNSESSLRKHRRKHSNKKHGCVTCGSRFTELRSLKIHIQMNHPNNSEEKSLPCEFCGKVFYSKLQLSRHKRYHQGKKYVCETCGKAFVDLRDLNVHKYKHTKEKPFTCELCGKGVANLSHHRVGCLEKLNAEEKNFKCSQCDKAFHLEAALKRHEGMHLNSDRFECEVCQRKFQYKSLFMTHRRTHFPDESLPCTMATCEGRFRNQSELNWHLEYDHFGNREKCSICGYEAKSRMYFNRHMLTHKKEKRFECDLCGKKFFRKAHVSRHRRTHEKSKTSVRENQAGVKLDGSGVDSHGSASELE